MQNFDLERPLLEFASEAESTFISLKDACTSILSIGATGSGKTSGSCAYLLQRLMAYGCGGLILCVKDEYEDILRYLRNTGREKDLIRVCIGGEHSFNFLEYESSRNGEINFVSNLVTLLENAIQAGKEQSDSGNGDTAFWTDSLRMLIHNCITINLLAYGTVSVPQLYEIALSITDSSPESAFEKTRMVALEKVLALTAAWEVIQDADYIKNLNAQDYNNLLFQAVPQAREFSLADQFFTNSFRQLHERTRAILEMLFTNFLFTLLQEPVYSLFSTRTTFSPEAVFEGKIILLDIPVKKFGQAAKYAQLLFKDIFQRAMERRNLKENNRMVFIFSDECQELLSPNDNTFLATSRSASICSLYATQNLPNLYACLGGSGSEHKIKGLLGNFGLKILHCNTDVETNEWASSLIGSGFQREDSETVTSANGTVTTARTTAAKLNRMVRPEEFVGLRNGSETNSLRVTAYLHAQGKKFSNGFSHKLVTFKQDYKPSL